MGRVHLLWKQISDRRRPAAVRSSPTNSRSVVVGPPVAVLLLWLAFWLRLPGLFGNSFHADEALFATWARYIATWQDPLLLTQAVDKPPLAFYLQALFYPLLGAVEWAARLPNFIAFLLLLPLTAQLARRLYGRQTAVSLTLLFLALSPYAIQFAPTAFLDPLWVTLVVAAMAVRKPGRSGVLFGLALATKYQAALFAPLILFLLLRPPGTVRPLHLVARWLAGCLPILFLLLAWEVARAGAFTLWQAQMQSYGGLRLAWSWELWPRLLAWLRLGRWLFGAVALALLFAGGVLLSIKRNSGEKARSTDRLLIGFGLAYLLLHWLLAVPTWERYLLPLLPLTAVLLGRLAAQWATPGHLQRQLALSALLLALMMGTAWQARNGRLPIGGQPGADAGARAIAACLADAPYGTVLYDHWYSWQWRYHLFDKNVYVSWVAHPQALARDLAVFGHNGQPRYLALPVDARALPFHRAVREAGFYLEPVATSGTIVLYAVKPAESGGHFHRNTVSGRRSFSAAVGGHFQGTNHAHCHQWDCL